MKYILNEDKKKITYGDDAPCESCGFPCFKEALIYVNSKRQCIDCARESIDKSEKNVLRRIIPHEFI
jgi:hypothetical protein